MPGRELKKSMLLSAIAGAVAWSGPWQLIPVSLALPILCGRRELATDWRGRGMTALAYYLGAIWPMLAAGIQLYGISAAPHLMLTWLFVAFSLAAAWTLPGRALPLILTAVPPLGIVGVAHPLTAAGILFPGSGPCGLLATLILPLAVLATPRYAIVVAAAVSLLLNVGWREPGPPAGWLGVNTAFGDIRAEMGPLAEFRAAEWIQKIARGTEAKVLVFPELVVTRWTPATTAFWQPTLDRLASQGKTLLIGAGLPLPGGREYENALVAVPAKSINGPARAVQSIPLPWVMWNPFALEDSAQLKPWGGRGLEVDGQRVGVLICYEQILVWPVLTMLPERPTALVAISNAVWTRGTPIPAVQAASVRAWSRLLSIPSLAAVNQ